MKNPFFLSPSLLLFSVSVFLALRASHRLVFGHHQQNKQKKKRKKRKKEKHRKEERKRTIMKMTKRKRKNHTFEILQTSDESKRKQK
ncbi:MAG: hypothetical protein JNN26_27105 [Candidatus Obscuribacter sp.]|nr:hypothetical protein [Candidatus Obscuribacter sp.]